MLDALPSLLVLGYLAGNLDLPKRGSHQNGVELVLGAAKVAGAMLVGYFVSPTAVTMAVSGFGAVGGLCFPFVKINRDLLYQTYIPLVAAATAMVVLMPRAAALGLIVFAFVFRASRKIGAAGLVATLVIPPAAWLMQGCDIFLLFGTMIWFLLLYKNLDRVEMQVRSSFGLKPGPLVFRQHLNRAIFIFVLVALLALFFLNRYVYHGFGFHPEVFRRGSSRLDFVALTFDDGPDPSYTPQILDILKKKGVKATFFVTGVHAENCPDIVRRIHDEGHEIGSHTYNHTNLFRADDDTTIRELRNTEGVLAEAADYKLKLFRPPRGLFNATVLQAAHDRGYTLVLWSLSSEDWLGTSPNRIVRLLSERTEGGEILLFHDSGDFFTNEGASRANTIQALPVLIDSLRSRGFRFVTVTELIIATHLVEGDVP